MKTKTVTLKIDEFLEEIFRGDTYPIHAREGKGVMISELKLEELLLKYSKPLPERKEHMTRVPKNHQDALNISEAENYIHGYNQALDEIEALSDSKENK